MAFATAFIHLLGELTDYGYVLSLRTFLTLGHGERHLLTFVQSLETVSVDGAEVNKHIWASFLSDKTKAFISVEPLNYTSHLRHIGIL